MIVVGLYGVLWGKDKELKRIVKKRERESSLEVEPLEIITTKQVGGESNVIQIGSEIELEEAVNQGLWAEPKITK